MILVSSKCGIFNGLSCNLLHVFMGLWELIIILGVWKEGFVNMTTVRLPKSIFSITLLIMFYFQLSIGGIITPSF